MGPLYGIKLLHEDIHVLGEVFESVLKNNRVGITRINMQPGSADFLFKLRSPEVRCGHNSGSKFHMGIYRKTLRTVGP